MPDTNFNTWVELVFLVRRMCGGQISLLFSSSSVRCCLSSIENGISLLCVCVLWKLYIWKSVILCIVNRYHSHEISTMCVCVTWNVFDILLAFSNPNFTEKGKKIIQKQSTISFETATVFLLIRYLPFYICTVYIHTQCSFFFSLGEGSHIQLKISLTENLMRHKNQIHCIIRLMACSVHMSEHSIVLSVAQFLANT